MTPVLTLVSQQWPGGGHCFQSYVACGVTGLSEGILLMCLVAAVTCLVLEKTSRRDYENHVRSPLSSLLASQSSPGRLAAASACFLRGLSSKVGMEIFQSQAECLRQCHGIPCGKALSLAGPGR